MVFLCFLRVIMVFVNVLKLIFLCKSSNFSVEKIKRYLGSFFFYSLDGRGGGYFEICSYVYG